jgi:hypothetical protein
MRRDSAALKVGDQRANLAFGVFVVLVNRKSQRVFQEWTRFRAATELDEKFAEKDARHHPVRLFVHAETVVLDRIGAATFRDERLGQTEAKHLVGRIAGHERAELLRP